MVYRRGFPIFELLDCSVEFFNGDNRVKIFIRGRRTISNLVSILEKSLLGAVVDSRVIITVELLVKGLEGIKEVVEVGALFVISEMTHLRAS